MNPSISQEFELLRNLLNQQSDLGIVIGSHQNLDTYASALALFAAFKAEGRNVQVVSKKAPTVEVANLVGIDKVKSAFSAGNSSKLVISLPYIKGEVEKVLFTEYPNPQNPTNINFHLTAAQGRSITPFDLNDVKLIWDGGAPGVTVTVGVGSIDELQGLFDERSAKIINIDNYQGNSRFGDVVIVDESFSSLSEISAKIIKDLNLPADRDSQQNILDGVLFATRNFTKPNTTPFAFEAASQAMYSGAKRSGEDRQPQQNERRRDQRPQNQPRNQNQNQNPRSSYTSQRVSSNDSQRVNPNDFPAMHMKQDPSDNSSYNQSFPQDQRGQQNFDQRNQPQDKSQFGQNPNDIQDLLQKINEENARKNQGGQNMSQKPRQDYQSQNPRQQNPQPQNRYQAQDAEVVDEPVQDDRQMLDEAPYNAQEAQDVPDDWLMPKVFKSSKNNN